MAACLVQLGVGKLQAANQSRRKAAYLVEHLLLQGKLRNEKQRRLWVLFVVRNGPNNVFFDLFTILSNLQYRSMCLSILSIMDVYECIGNAVSLIGTPSTSIDKFDYLCLYSYFKITRMSSYHYISLRQHNGEQK